MNIELNKLPTLDKDIFKRVQKYSWFAFIISVLLIYTFLVLRISQLSQAEADDAAVAEKSSTIKRLKIDEDSVEKIQQLQDQNIAVQSLFEEARDNPFE